MIDAILSSLPPDVQEDLATRTNDYVGAGLLRFPSNGALDDRLEALNQLATMSPSEVLSSLGRWTGFGAYLHELVVFTTIAMKRVEHFLKIEQNAIRMRLGLKSATEVAQAVFTDPRARCLDEAVQSLQELRAVLESRERACRSAAEAASRAITSHQTEVERLRLEARRG